MTGSSIPADQKVSQSKAATLTKKEKRPTRDLTRAEEKEPEREGPKRTVKVETSQAEWTTAASPLPEGASEGTHTTKAGETKEKKLLSFRVLRRTKPEVTLQRVTAPQSPPKIESTRDVSESKGSPRCPSETEASSLVSSTKQDREHASAQPHAKPATSARLKLDTVDPQRQKLLVKLLDVPTGDCRSPKNGSHGVQRVAPSVSSRERLPRWRPPLRSLSPLW